MKTIGYNDIAYALDKKPVLSRVLYISYMAKIYRPTCIYGSNTSNLSLQDFQGQFSNVYRLSSLKIRSEICLD